MNKLKYLFVALVLLTAAVVAVEPLDAQQKPPVSPHDKVSTKISGKLVTIYYGRPNAKGREIWGGKLAPYGKAWRAGADEATTLITDAPLMIGDTAVDAGAYTLYMIPGEKDAKLAISKHVGQWGIPVDEKNDLARVGMKKDSLPEKLEQFTISFEKSGTGANLKLAWGDAQYSVPVSLKK